MPLETMQHIFLSYLQPIDDWPAWVVALLFFGPMTGGLFIYFYATRHARSWRRGIFPHGLKPTEDNFLEAFLALGAKLMLVDYQHTKDKVTFINSYFNRYFPKANYNFGDSLLFSLRHPIQIDTVTNWLKIQWAKEGERSQIIYFLVGLAVQTEHLNPREIQLLKQISVQMELSEDYLQRIIAMYVVNQKERLKQEKHHVEPKRLHLDCLMVLGLKEGASHDEIKKAYRGMAKKHHPDRFEQASESQRKIAESKFLEIQRAYELLTSDTKS